VPRLPYSDVVVLKKPLMKSASEKLAYLHFPFLNTWAPELHSALDSLPILSLLKG
jgi:hypothetical protein